MATHCVTASAWIGGLILLAVPAAAQAPVAIVEEVAAKSADVEFMDTLPPGRVIALAPDDTMVLGYMRSCWRETIKAGTVTIGAEQSIVKDGKVDRIKVPCDGGRMDLNREQAKSSAAGVFRKGPGKGAAQPELTIFGLSPIIEARGGGRLVLERIDAKGAKIEIDLATRQLDRGAFLDLAKSGTSLAAGGIYRASISGRQVLFKVDPSASPGAGPVVGRLVRLPPAS